MHGDKLWGKLKWIICTVGDRENRKITQLEAKDASKVAECIEDTFSPTHGHNMHIFRTFAAWVILLNDTHCLFGQQSYSTYTWKQTAGKNSNNFPRFVMHKILFCPFPYGNPMLLLYVGFSILRPFCGVIKKFAMEHFLLFHTSRLQFWWSAGKMAFTYFGLLTLNSSFPFAFFQVCGYTLPTCWRVGKNNHNGFEFPY